MKQTIYSLAGAFGLHRVSASRNRHRPVILTFHGVTSDRSDTLCNAEGLHLHRPIFERLIDHVARHYRVVPLARIVDWLDGRAPAPEQAVAITFDDGFRNVLTDAAPVLKRYRMPATLFVSTDFVFKGDMLWPDRLLAALASTRRDSLEIAGRPFDLRSREGRLGAYRTLLTLCKSLPQEERLALIERTLQQLDVDAGALANTWDGFRPIDPDELRLLPGAGITAGAHTCSHPILAKLSATAQARELTESRRLIEAATGVECVEFAYPNGSEGDFSEQTRAAVIGAGYRCAFTTVKRRVSDTDDRFEIPRCTLTHNGVTVSEFAAELSGFSAALRALRDRVRPRATPNHTVQTTLGRETAA